MFTYLFTDYQERYFDFSEDSEVPSHLHFIGSFCKENERESLIQYFEQTYLEKNDIYNDIDDDTYLLIYDND